MNFRVLPATAIFSFTLAACATGQAEREDESADDAPSTAGPVQAPVPTELPTLAPEDLPNFAPSFLRGVNLGNRLDAPSEGEWGAILRETDFEFAAERGFDHLRLPVRFSTRADTAAPFSVQENFLLRVDWAIEQALLRDLSIVLDFHHYEEIMMEPAAHRARFLAIWEQLAERYQDYPPALAFELLNEPSGALGAATWNAMAAEAITIIRTTNPTRDIIVDAVEFAATRTLSQLVLPDDPNVIASVHTYEPSLFVFQGQSWMPPIWGTKGIVFPGPPTTPVTPVAAALAEPWAAAWLDNYNSLPAETNPSGPSAIREQFDQIEAFIASSGHRVYDGEWGPQDGADLASRSRYMRALRTEAEARSIGWCVWEDSGAMKLFDPLTGVWNEDLADALFD